MSWKLPGLERVSQVVFIVMCIVVTGVAVQRLTMASSGPTASRVAPIPEGTRLRIHDDLRPGTARASLVLALSTSCQFCTESMGFYRRLAELDVVRDGRLRLSVVSAQAPDKMREYLASHRLAISPVVLLRESGVSVQGTPMLVLLHGDGVVSKSWVGQLMDDEEEDVISAAREVASR